MEAIRGDEDIQLFVVDYLHTSVVYYFSRVDARLKKTLVISFQP